MRPLFERARRPFGIGLWVALAMVAAACTPPGNPPDYRAAFPLTVTTKTFAVAVRISRTGVALSDRDDARLRDFAREYIRRARGSLVLATAPGDEAPTDQVLIRNLRARLEAEGVRPDDIVVNLGGAPVGGENAVVLSFVGYHVQVPECGDWSGEAGFDPNNLPHSNYGCSYQRNIGLIVANPADLIKSGPVGPIDVRRSGDILDKYGKGQPTATATPTAEQGSVGTQ